MLTFKNAQGQDVYRIERVTDLALLPDNVMERNDVFKQTEFFILNLRLLLVAARAEGMEDHMIAEMQPYVDFVDDGEVSASIGDETLGEVFYKATLYPAA